MMNNDLVEQLLKKRAVIIEEDGAIVFQQFNHLQGFIKAYKN